MKTRILEWYFVESPSESYSDFYKYWISLSALYYLSKSIIEEMSKCGHDRYVSFSQLVNITENLK